MGWEKRGARRYYYTKKREGNKVVSEYKGSGSYVDAVLTLAAHTDTLIAHRREMERLELERFIQEVRSVDREIDEFRAQVRQVVEVVLREVGYRKRRGQWRMPLKVTALLEAPKVTRAEVDEFHNLLDAADKETAKPSDIDKAKLYAQDRPGLFDGTRMMAHNVLISVLDSVSMSPATRIICEGEVAALRRSLGEANASPLERLLIDDIAICWMRLQFMELGYDQNTNNASFKKAEFYERRLSTTRKRYLQSVESLAKVRRLLARAGVQINVAEQQVVVNG